MMKVFKNTHDFFSFQRIDDNGSPITTTPQELYFSVKKNIDNEEEKPVIEKRMTTGDIVSFGGGEWRISILPSDTRNLATGKYSCDVKVIDETGLNFIIVEPQTFEIAKVVTLAGG